MRKGRPQRSTRKGSSAASDLYTGQDATSAAEDIDNDKDLDGPFAVGRDRVAIRVRGNLVGDIRHTGTITVEGNESAGISVAGLLDGDFVHDGKTSVLGDDSVGVEVGDVTGNVRLAGTISAAGEGSSAAHLGGDIDGALVVQGSIATTGYRYTTAPTDPSKLDDDDLLGELEEMAAAATPVAAVPAAVPTSRLVRVEAAPAAFPVAPSGAVLRPKAPAVVSTGM